MASLGTTCRRFNWNCHFCHIDFHGRRRTYDSSQFIILPKGQWEKHEGEISTGSWYVVPTVTALEPIEDLTEYSMVPQLEVFEILETVEEFELLKRSAVLELDHR